MGRSTSWWKPRRKVTGNMNALFLVLCLTSAPQDNPNRWTAGNTALELVFNAFQIVDIGQTYYALKNMPGAEEANPLLGKHPSKEQLRNLMVLGMLGHAAVSYLLPTGLREVWQTLSIFAVSYNDMRNIDVMGGLYLKY